MPRESSLLPAHAEAAADRGFVSWVNPADGSQLRVIPGGEFIMGSTTAEIEAAKALDRDGPLFGLLRETPQFCARIPSFSIGVHAVTNQQFARFLSAMRPSAGLRAFWIPDPEQIVAPSREEDAYSVRGGFERHPAIHISWFGAEAYCRWAGLRLPAELEWEKAARGADGRIFPWGDEWAPEALCWWGSHAGEESTAPIDAFPAGLSPYGLFQMAGNVEEWCADWYQPRVYDRYAAGDLEPPRAGLGRVVRGGNALRKNRLEFRCAMRRANSPAFTNILLTGIRCASSLAPEAAAPGQPA